MYRVVFLNCSSPKNGLVLDYIVNPIKKVSDVPKSLAPFKGGTVKKTTLCEKFQTPLA